MMTQPAKTRSLILYGLALSLVAAVACGDDDDPIPSNNNNNTTNNNNNNNTTPNIAELATANGLSSLVQAATDAGLVGALSGTDELTVFAPTDAAFTALGDAAPADPDLLANVLLHHIVSGSLDSTAVTTMGPFTTLANTSLAVDTATTPPTVGGAALSSTLDLMASNGIVHVMDEVIIPPTILETASVTDDLSTLFTAVGASTTAEAALAGEGPLTVFAPTNAAFMDAGIDLGVIDQATLDKVLTYHVAAGQITSGGLSDGQMITMASGDILTVSVSTEAVTLTDLAGNTSTVTATDIRLLNGVVHIINGVLIPTP